MASAAQLLETLESAGWTVDIAPLGLGLTGLAVRPDGDAGTLRLTAYGRNRTSVVLLLFEQACAGMLPDPR